MLPYGSALRRCTGFIVAFVLAGCASPPPPSSSNLDPLHQATVVIEHDKGHGTGLIVGPDTVLTANHVVEGTPLEVQFFYGQTARGHIQWRDQRLDLALIAVAVPERYAPARVSCAALQPGQHLVTIGHPTGARWVAVGGYLPHTQHVADRFVSLGVPIGLGTSGGPVFDGQGRVVGIAQAILAERTSAAAAMEEYKDTGIGLMLPASEFCDEIAAQHRF